MVNQTAKLSCYSRHAEYCWKFFLVFLTVPIFVCFFKINEFHQLTIIKDNLISESFYDEFVYCSISLLIITFSKKYFIRSIKPLIVPYFLDINRYPTQEQQQSRRSLLQSLFTQSLWYSFMSIWGFILLKNQDFNPLYLGGTGFSERLLDNYPKINQEMLQVGLRHFYLIQLSFRIETFLFLIIHLKENKIYEMGLHHLVALFLILFSYLTNQTNVGVLVLFTHDFSDIMLIIGRLYPDFKYKSDVLLNIAYILILFIWIYLRLIVMPHCAIYQAFRGSIVGWDKGFNKEIHDHLSSPLFNMAIMLLILTVLNIFWTYKMILSAFAKLFKNQLLIEEHKKKS